MQKLALMIAEEMTIPIHEYQLLEVAALLHDVGSVALPDAIIKNLVRYHSLNLKLFGSIQ